jgi:hypothetical protein
VLGHAVRCTLGQLKHQRNNLQAAHTASTTGLDWKTTKYTMRTSSMFRAHHLRAAPGTPSLHHPW